MIRIHKGIAAGLALLAVGAIAIGVYAALTFQKDVATGTFTTGSETLNLTTQTIKLDCTGGMTFTCTNPVNVADGSWLQKAFAPDGNGYVIGAVRITNSSPVSSIFTHMTTKDVVNIGGLADQMDIKIKIGAAGATPEVACSGEASTYNNSKKLSALPSFGDPTDGAQAGDITLTPGASRIVCILAGLPVITPIFDGSASGTFTFAGSN